MSTQDVISENINTLMLRARLTQTDLAALTGIGRVTIGQRISGRNKWRADELDVMADVLDVTVAELVSTIPDRQEWDRRRNPAQAVAPGPRYFVMPEDLGDGTPPLSNLSPDVHYRIFVRTWVALLAAVLRLARQNDVAGLPHAALLPDDHAADAHQIATPVTGVRIPTTHCAGVPLPSRLPRDAQRLADHGPRRSAVTSRRHVQNSRRLQSGRRVHH